MNAADLAIVAENIVLLVAIITGGSLFKQGGGWQWKTPPVPKAPQQPKREADAKPDAKNADLVPFEKAS